MRMSPRLHAIEHGAGDPVVYLHGVGSDATAWTPQLEAVPGHRAVAIHMPGYGTSPTSPIDAAAALADLVLEALPTGRLHLVGLSLGAVVAAHAAAKAGPRVASLTLASGFLRYPDGEAVAARAQEAARNGMATLAAARVGRILHPDAAAAVRSEVRATMARIPPDAYQRMSRAVWTADLTQVAASLRVPTLVLSGDADPVTPPSLGRQLAEAIPGSAFTALPRASHLLNLDQPAAFNALLRRHVEGTA
jgi:pimeloyl-ACP methyl ester carboxylesterase